MDNYFLIRRCLSVQNVVVRVDFNTLGNLLQLLPRTSVHYDLNALGILGEAYSLVAAAAGALVRALPAGIPALVNGVFSFDTGFVHDIPHRAGDDSVLAPKETVLHTFFLNLDFHRRTFVTFWKNTSGYALLNVFGSG